MYTTKFVVGAISLFVVFSSISRASSQAAPECTPTSNCSLPNCRCSGTDIPGNLSRSDTPQLVFLSFDAAVNVDNIAFYREVLYNRKNPNNQPITATFFVSHDYTIYSHVHELYRKGHEIGLHSISTNPSQDYWRNLNESMWRKELVDQREQITTFARVPANDIKGVRAPQLQIGGDTMYNVLKQARLIYDASRPTLDYRLKGLFPYTNDYNSTQDCQIPPCPVNQHSGFWSVPLINYISDSGNPCSLADQCTPLPNTSDTTYALLRRNFETHYNNHRSPFGIFTRHGWVNGTGDADKDDILQRRIGYERFLDHLATLPDVYIVSIARGLEWVKNPTPISSVSNFPAFQVSEKANQCARSYSCDFKAEQTPFKPPYAQERYFTSCIPCPVAYPWVGNHLGRDRYS